MPTFESRYFPLVKAERDKVEHDASVLEGRTNTLAKFMAMIDEQHADMKTPHFQNIGRTA
jgi:hypothetical protein